LSAIAIWQADPVKSALSPAGCTGPDQLFKLRQTDEFRSPAADQ
jgi:hypothetical protein